MKLFFLISFLMFPALAFAQDERVDCAAALAAPPFVDMLYENDARELFEISTQNSGRVLLELNCNIDDITEFFENSGWELTRFVKETHDWVDGEFIRVPENVRKSKADFCVKLPKLLGLFPTCVASATVAFIGGQLVGITPHISK